jgi:uncharacterized integral membrane protein (TIGR00698 family)
MARSLDRPAALLAASVIGGLAVAAGALPGSVSPLLVALLAGLAVANVVPAAGARFHAALGPLPSQLLRVGIVLLGARGSIELIAAVGPHALVVVAITMTAVFGFVALVARRLRLLPELAVLLAVGTAVCGNSAIAAVAPLIRARRPEVALAIGTITVFGTVALFVYPVFGRMLGLDDREFGIWAGAGVHDTSQVVATAFAFSPAAGDVATVVKLGRNTLMLPILFAVALLFRGQESRFSSVRPSLLLVGGYGAMVVANSIGLLPDSFVTLASIASTIVLAVAMAGFGFGIRLAELRSLGRTAILAGFAAALVGGTVALAATVALGE